MTSCIYRISVVGITIMFALIISYNFRCPDSLEGVHNASCGSADLSNICSEREADIKSSSNDCDVKPQQYHLASDNCPSDVNKPADTSSNDVISVSQNESTELESSINEVDVSHWSHCGSLTSGEDTSLWTSISSTEGSRSLQSNQLDDTGDVECDLSGCFKAADLSTDSSSTDESVDEDGVSRHILVNDTGPINSFSGISSQALSGIPETSPSTGCSTSTPKPSSVTHPSTGSDCSSSTPKATPQLTKQYANDDSHHSDLQEKETQLNRSTAEGENVFNEEDKENEQIAPVFSPRKKVKSRNPVLSKELYRRSDNILVDNVRDSQQIISTCITDSVLMNKESTEKESLFTQQHDFSDENLKDNCEIPKNGDIICELGSPNRLENDFIGELQEDLAELEEMAAKLQLNTTSTPAVHRCVGRQDNGGPEPMLNLIGLTDSPVKRKCSGDRSTHIDEGSFSSRAQHKDGNLLGKIFSRVFV